jgi:O-antigen biosynthesis protein WbqP
MDKKRFFDIVFSIIAIVLFLPVLILIYIAIFLLDGFNPLYFSRRVGYKNKIFLMPKFRTMKMHTPQKATNKLKKPEKYITFFGKTLRRTSLDELPQLFSIFFGQMSFVGPRPALFNQKTLISLRTKKKIHYLIPGITGLAQINGRDKLSIKKKVYYDEVYLKKKSLFFDFKILLITLKILADTKKIKH